MYCYTNCNQLPWHRLLCACDLVSFVCLPGLNMKCCRNRLLRNDHSDSRQKNGAIAEIEQMVNSSAHKQNGNAVEMLHKITIQHEYMFINDFRCYFFSCLFFCVECVCFSFHRHIYNTFPLNGRAWSVYLHNRMITENQPRNKAPNNETKKKKCSKWERRKKIANIKQIPFSYDFSCLLFYLGNVHTCGR